MKKKTKITIAVIAALILLLAVLFVPIPSGICNDGGTRVYSSLTYKLIHWHRFSDISGCEKYDKLKIYFIPEKFKTVDELWEKEQQYVEYSFIATVIEKNGSSVTVQPIENNVISSDRVSFSVDSLEKLEYDIGSVVKIKFSGEVMESYPVQIVPLSWELSDDLRHLEYTGEWIDDELSVEYSNDTFGSLYITKIYSNCFFARPVIPMPDEIKINGSISDEWCVGDEVVCELENMRYYSADNRFEADLVSIEESDWQPDKYKCYKPVIYLYPEYETEVSVKLDLNGRVTCTYPAYNNGWTVIASPDGTLTDQNGRSYNYLYWEGEADMQCDFSHGFCVKGSDTAEFLEYSLEKLGLNRREANEFIVYWLPLMEENPYNIISFQTENYENSVPLEINPSPDTLIRVFMAWMRSESYIDLTEQNLTALARNGFTVVEWGGGEIK